MRGLEGKQQMAQMLDSLRTSPPKEIAGVAVTSFEDLRDEKGKRGPLQGATDAASRNVLLFRLGARARIALRPSGTEPKAKIYLEVASAPCPAAATPEFWQKQCREVDTLMALLAADFENQALGRVGLGKRATGSS
jgi:phosphoglucomutase/phosphomannomutase